MGTTFVTLTHGATGSERGFWMRDELLELWLRLLALHLPEPTDSGEHRASIEIRSRWLLASRGGFTGCIPHCLEDACATPEGREVVRLAIDSLLLALGRAPATLDAGVLGLLGIEGYRAEALDRQMLQDIGAAFADLIGGKVAGTASSTAVMPGSKPYQRGSSG